MYWSMAITMIIDYPECNSHVNFKSINTSILNHAFVDDADGQLPVQSDLSVLCNHVTSDSLVVSSTSYINYRNGH